MSLKRKIFNFFVAAVMVLGSMPITLLSVYAEDQPGEAPKSLKTVKSNNDGTYDITLEIEGVSSSENEATKANVVVVFDSSGSMGDNATTYSYSESSSGRYRLVNGDYVQLYRRSGFFNSCNRMESDNSTTNVYTDSNCSNLYTGTRYTRTTNTGTRLSVAKAAVNVLANELLSQNDSDTPGFEDVVEMAFVNFGSTVKTNTTHTTPTTDLDTFKGWVSATSASGGTNWEDALTTAKNISFGDDDKTYIIFVSDGNPTFRISQYGASNNDCDNWSGSGSNRVCTRWGNGSTDPSPYRNFNAAKDVADEIVANPNMELYAVGAFGDATNMQNLGGTYYNASNQDALEAAFAEIVDKITTGLSVADLQIEDGITTATSTEVSGTAGHFRYSVPDSWGDDWAEATFEDGSVHWNPGHDKTLTNGEKASVTFTVWPSQEAMNCIAAVRNDGTCGMTDEELATYGLAKNSDGSFKLLTNSSATFKYRTATTIEGGGETSYSALSAPVTFDEERDPTNLPETELEVTKLWADGMDPAQRDDIKEISLDLFIDRAENPEAVKHYVFNKQGGQGNEWKSSYTYAVAPGVMKKLDGTDATEGLRDLGRVVKVGNDEYVILEEGHDYEFDNEAYNLNDGGSNHYHITKRKYHPMIVGEGGHIHDVVFSEDGKTAEIDSVELTKLSAENTLNGGILVSKKVINNDKEDTDIADEYEITIRLQGENAQTGQYRIYTYNDDGTVASKGDKINYTGGVITEKIKVNQKIMVTDVPTGTKFTVSEVLPDGYTDNEIGYEVIKYKDGETESLPGIHEVFGNASSTATVTNYLESGDLKISKEVTATSGNLAQAQAQTFDFAVNFYEAQGDSTAVRTETFQLKHGESKEFKDIPAGWYYEITEDAKAGFNDGEATTKTGTIKKKTSTEVEFENDYKVSRLNDDDAKVIAIKNFVSGYEPFWLDSDQFTFQLSGNGEVVEKTVTKASDTAEFIVNITDEGTYTYTITEKTQGEDGSSLLRPGVSRLQGDEDIVVTIETKDNGDGTLSLVSKEYSKESKKIFNLYEATGTYGAEGELKFNKVLEGRDWLSSDEFTFTIESEDGPLPKQTTKTAKKGQTEFDFGEIKFTNQDVGKTYSYVVKESFDIQSVEPADGVASGISFTITVTDNEDGTLNLEVSDYEHTFTNIYKTTDVSVTKVWDDDGDRDGLRQNYEGYYVAVKNDEDKFVAYAELEDEDKVYAFEDLPEKNADGEVIEYVAAEASKCSGEGEAIKCTEFTSDDDYTAIIENNTITNKHEPEPYGDLMVQKIWLGEDNELVRPTTIQIELYGEITNDEGEKVTWMVGDPVTVSEASEWKWTYEGLYKYENGKEVTYSVQETILGETEFGEDESVIVVYKEDGETLDGKWEKSIDGFEITNTWTPATDEIVYEGESEFYIKKVDENYKTMQGVTFAINDDEEQTGRDGQIKVEVPVSTKPEDKEESFEYEISEKETLEGYDLTEGSATVAVSCTSELADTNTETLVNTYAKTCTFEKDGSDKYVWNEDDMALTVVNKRSLAKSLTIKKSVVGVSLEVLKDVTFTITGPEDFGEDGEMTLTLGEDCVASGDDEAICKVDAKIPTGKYTVKEDNAEIEYFTLTVSGDDGKTKKVGKDERVEFEIENKYDVDKTTYTVIKVWDDVHNQDGKRPEKLIVNLYGDDELVESKDLTNKNVADEIELPAGLDKDDVWMYEFENLPVANEMAEVIQYFAEEELESDDYEQIEAEDGEYMAVFVNYHEPTPPEDPCATGGCGGVIYPPLTPNTGRWMIENRMYGGTRKTIDGSLIAATVVIATMSMVALMGGVKAVVVRRKK